MRRFTDGRDEMNLAEFPISVLQHQQPVTGDGTKRDTVTYESSRYDAAARQRLQQRVVLETTSRHGLPTPADENVVLALLYVAKHAHNFAEDVVHFAPRQLFTIMGWAPNSRSYVRLRQVLRRLKSLVIRYENSWWDRAGRSYEAEFATGIVSEYEIARQTSGRRKEGAVPASWVRFSPHFHRSLTNGNLKKLDLEQLFSLRLPSSQRMYRFLDKRFYPRHQPPPLEMDLTDFACGHIGFARVGNVAELKRRLAPAIAELESIGFIDKSSPAERYQKVRAGVWRIRFRAGPRFSTAPAGEAALPSEASAPQVVAAAALPPARGEAGEMGLVAEFYRIRDGRQPYRVGAGDREQAGRLLREFGADGARALLPLLARIVKRKWPDCRSLSGAVDKYLAEAVALYEQGRRRTEHQELEHVRRRQDLDETDRWAAERRELETRWQALPEGRRREIEEEILRRHPEHQGRTGILRMLCLKQLRTRPEAAPPAELFPPNPPTHNAFPAS